MCLLLLQKAAARERGIELYEYLGDLTGNSDFKIPEPMFNVVNGGKHADSGLDIQEFMIVPPGIETFERKILCQRLFIISKKLFMGVDIRLVLETKGICSKLSSNEEALEFIVRAIKDSDIHLMRFELHLMGRNKFYQHDGYHVKISGLKKILKVKKNYSIGTNIWFVSTRSFRSKMDFMKKIGLFFSINR